MYIFSRCYLSSASPVSFQRPSPELSIRQLMLHSLHTIFKAVSHSVLNPKQPYTRSESSQSKRNEEITSETQTIISREYASTQPRVDTADATESPERARTPASHVYTDVLNVSIMRLTVPVNYSTLSSLNTLRSFVALRCPRCQRPSCRYTTSRSPTMPRPLVSSCLRSSCL